MVGEGNWARPERPQKISVLVKCRAPAGQGQRDLELKLGSLPALSVPHRGALSQASGALCVTDTCALCGLQQFGLLVFFK